MNLSSHYLRLLGAELFHLAPYLSRSGQVMDRRELDQRGQHEEETDSEVPV